MGLGCGMQSEFATSPERLGADYAPACLLGAVAAASNEPSSLQP